MPSESTKEAVRQVVKVVESRGMTVDDWMFHIEKEGELEISFTDLKATLDELVSEGHIGRYYEAEQQLFCADIGDALLNMEAELEEEMSTEELAKTVAKRTGMPRDELFKTLRSWNEMFG